MAKSLTPQDVHALINLVAREATGQNSSIMPVNSSAAVSVGELVAQAGTENILNALSIVMGRTFMAVRPYEAKLFLINAINSGMFTERMRKISYYAKDSQASGWFNTNLYTQHATGLDNGVNQVKNSSILPSGGLGTMWEQNQPMPLEVNFAGRDVWSDSITLYENQLQRAFRNDGEFASFVSGIMTEKGNNIESQKEAFNRVTMLNFIAGVIDLNQDGSVVDLKAAYNAAFGTNYSSAQLRTTYLKEFLAFTVATIKTVSEYMRIRSKKYHLPYTKSVGGVDYSILRHTPRDRQRLLIYAPLTISAEAQVFSEVFNPQYLDIGQYEKVTHWQNINNPSAIDVTPAIPNIGSPASGQTTGNRVQYDYVVGMLYDQDAILTDYQMDSAYTTPLEARKGYRNIWYQFAKNSINDFTENAVVFVMGNDA